MPSYRFRLEGATIARLEISCMSFGPRTGLAERLAAEAWTDYEEAGEILMKSHVGIPLGRPATAREVAEVIASVVSGTAGAITVTEYVIDGGTVATA